MPDPRTAAPVRPLRRHERAYEARIKRRILAPLQSDIQRRLNAAAANAREWNREIQAAFDSVATADDLPLEYLNELRDYHTGRSATSLSRAFEIDVRPFLQDGPLRPVMAQHLKVNVGLIQSIPENLNAQVLERFDAIVTEHGFDQQRMVEMLQNRFDVAGSRARFIARDQTSKIIGDLSKVRNKQLGISEYIWETSDDSRVRASHNRLDGTRQKWDTPPDVGHPGEDYQCRCVAKPVIPRRQA